MDNNNIPNLGREDMDDTSDDTSRSPPQVSRRSPLPERFVANPELRRSAFASFANVLERNRTALQAPDGLQAPAEERDRTAPPPTPVLRPLDAVPRPLPGDIRNRGHAFTPFGTAPPEAFALNDARATQVAPSRLQLASTRLSRAEIRSVPERAITTADLDDDGEAQCSICIESLSVGDMVCCLCCHHFYHRECIGAWFANNNTCPKCRKVYVPPPARDREDDKHMRRDDRTSGGGGSGGAGATAMV